MADRQTLTRDLTHLIARIGANDLFIDQPGGKPSVQASLLALPTLAERKRMDEVARVAAALLDRRDETGGWDDPWTTIIGVEAFVALRLRGIEVEGGESVLEFAVNVLKGTDTLEPEEREMRLARAIILSGLAKQDATLIDAGILRIHALLEKKPAWSDDLGDALHAMLTLADLFAVSKDPYTRELLDQRVDASGLLQVDEWADEENEPETLARAGVVLVKLGHNDLALEVYHRAAMIPAAELDTASLKHRVELGARLEEQLPAGAVRHEEEDEPSLSGADAPVDQPKRQAANAQRPALDLADLPARSAAVAPRISTLVVEENDPEAVEFTVRSLLAQDTLPGEILIAWATPGRRIESDRDGVHLRQLTDSGRSVAGRWQALLALAEGTFVHPLPAGTRVPDGLIDALHEAASVDDETPARLATPAPGMAASQAPRLMIEPTLPPHRVLLLRASVLGQALPDGLHHLAPWAWMSEFAQSEGWSEVRFAAAGDEVEITLHNALSVLEDAPALWRARPGGVALQAERRGWLKQRRTSVYAQARRDDAPLASVILDLHGPESDSEQTLTAILDRTDGMAFELIAIVNDDSDSDLLRSLEQLGLLPVQVPADLSPARARTLAADRAAAPYLVFVDHPVQVSEGWLPALVHTLHEESAHLVAGRLYAGGDDDSALRGGVVFDEQGRPSVLEETHQRLPVQAVAGGITALRAVTLHQAGGFSDLPDPWSWVDLSLRFRRNGLAVVHEPAATAQLIAADASDPHVGFGDTPEAFANRWQGRITPDASLYAALQSAESDRVETPARASAVDPEASIRQLLAQADALIKEGRYDEVDSRLGPAEGQLNGNAGERVQFWTLLGDARFRLDRPEEAYDCYQKAVKDDPSAERAWIGIGTFHMVKDDFETAGDIFQKVVTLNPTSLRGHLGLANTLLRAQKSGEAIPHFQNALKLDPGHRHAMVGLVAAAVQAERMSEAGDALRSYLLQHPEDVEARFHHAAILFGTHRNDDARIEAEEVLKLKPDHTGAKEILNHTRNVNPESN